MQFRPPQEMDLFWIGTVLMTTTNNDGAIDIMAIVMIYARGLLLDQVYICDSWDDTQSNQVFKPEKNIRTKLFCQHVPY